MDEENAPLFCCMGSPSKINTTLFTAVLITCFGSLLFGYSMGVLNNLEIKIKCQMDIDTCDKFGENATERSHKATALYGGLTAAYVVLGTVGCFCSGMMSDYFGRRNSMIINNGIAIVGSLVVLLFFAVPHVSILFISRLILGLNAGLTTGIAPTFIAEITPTSIRGAVTCCHQLSITIGITLSYLMTMSFILNQEDIWVFALALPVIFSAIAIGVLPFLPESPRYLYLNANKPEEAIEAFVKYNKVQDPAKQMKEMQDEVDLAKSAKQFSVLDLCMGSQYRKPVIISVLLMVMQQFSGINAIMAYSSTMLKAAGVSKSMVQIYVLLIGLLNTCSTIPAVILMDVAGRRIMLIIPSILAILSLIGSFIVIGIIPTFVHAEWLAILALVFICLYIVGFALGMGPIPGIIVAEMFLQAPRAAAYSMAAGINWFSSFVILLLYPIIDNVLPKGYVFIIFFAISIPCLAYLIIFMPETKNRTFADISQGLTGNKVEDKA